MGYELKKEKYDELLELQRKYENGEIDDSDLTLEELDLLNKLYDIQIKELTKSNELRKQKLLEFRTEYQSS